MSMFVVEILESFLGKPRKHNDSKGQIAFDCPACAENGEGEGSGNLEVNYEKNLFRCWSCQYTNHMSGLIPKLILRYGNSELLKEYLILKPDTYNHDNDASPIVVKFPIGYTKLATCPKDRFKYNEVIRYLEKRGIGMDLITKYDIGYTVDDRFMNRIIIPSYDAFGDINYFIARSFHWKTKPKYMNPEAEKQEIIFNENKINWDSTIYLVEGVFDHIVVPNSIPLLGKFMSEKLFNEIYTKASGNIVILLDADAYEDAVFLYKKLNIGHLSGKILMCTPAESYDPSLIYEKWGKKGIVTLLKSSTKLLESRLY